MAYVQQYKVFLNENLGNGVILTQINARFHFFFNIRELDAQWEGSYGQFFVTPEGRM